MIRILTRKEIDIQLWDACVEKSSNGQIFGYSWYLDSCCPDWKGIVKNNYEAIFPFSSKSKFGVNYIYQPFFTRHFGVYSSVQFTDEEHLEILNSIPKKYLYWDFNLNKSHHVVPVGVQTEKKVYQEIDLHQEYSLIRKSYNENLIRNLKKSEIGSLLILKNFNPESVVSQFKIHQKDKQLGFDENDFKTLSLVAKNITERGQSICWAVTNETGEILAGAFFILSNNRIVYLKGFSSLAGKKCGAMHYLFDQLISENANKNLTLDFGGSNVETVARFYKSFGAKDCLYLHLKSNRLPPILKWLKR